jgi:hypothetical protein
VSACEGCGAELPPEPTRPGPKRKWCSDHCRKRTWDDRSRATCIDCGAKMAARSGWPHRGASQARCQACGRAHRRARRDAEVRRVAILYNQGASYKEIAAALGYRETSVPSMLLREARKLGLIGYRNRGYDRQDVAA